MDKAQYKQRVMENTNLSEAEFDQKYVVLECKNCDAEGCHGWQLCPNDPDIIKMREEDNARDDDA